MGVTDRRLGDGDLIGAAVVGALGLAALVFATLGTGERGLHVALRLTARWSYVWFCGAYAGGALARLFGPGFRALAQRGRALGLGFAAAQTVHVAIVAWLFGVAAKPPLGPKGVVFFLLALACTYALAGLSFGGARRLPGALWKILRVGGMEYIAFAFFADFYRHPVRSVADALLYWPFIALAVCGTTARIAAALKRQEERLLF